MAINVKITAPGKVQENVTINCDASNKSENYTWLRIIAYMRCVASGVFPEADADISEELRKLVDEAEKKITEANNNADRLVAQAMREKAEMQEQMRGFNTLQRENIALREENQRLANMANMRGPVQITPVQANAAPVRQPMPSAPAKDPNAPWLEID